MRLQHLVDVSNAVAGVRGRLEKTSRLADLLRQLHPNEIAIAVAFLSGTLIQGRVGLGWAAIVHARSVAEAEAPSLELPEVNAAFEQIGAATGAGSSKERTRLLVEMFRRATSTEQDFLVRLVGGELRQGAVEGVLADAIAKAAGTSGDVIRNAAMMCGDLGDVARVALVEGSSALSKYAIQIFRPVEPMLASTAESVTEAIEWLGEAAFELKLDGARIQVHKSGEDVRVFSRALRDVTAAVPEVVEAVRHMPAREVILDGEVLALSATASTYAVSRDDAPVREAT